jgi:uncharacterized protein YciI
MDKKYFALKLIPSRPDFAQTMTDTERGIMNQHVAYWKKYMDEGIAIVFGPVLDPKGVYGFGIVSVDDEGQVTEIIRNDPAAAINSYEYYPMLAIVAAK